MIMKKRLALLIIALSFLIFYTGSCIHTELVYITITGEPKIKLDPEATIVVHNFWLNNKDDPTLTFRPEKEISQKFRDVLEQGETLKVLPRKSYKHLSKLSLVAREDKSLSILSYIEKRELNWVEITKDEPCDYLLLGETAFEVVDGSGYEYRRIYDPFSRTYKYNEVFVKQKIFNIKVTIILIDVKKNKVIYEDIYNDSRIEAGDIESNLTQFLWLSEFSVERFISSFTPEIEKQYRYLLGR